MKRILHWFAHLFGWNAGRVETWYAEDGKTVMIGFRCVGCGKLTGVHPIPKSNLQGHDNYEESP